MTIWLIGPFFTSLSHRFHSLAGDSELWKRQYYSRWVRPRARRLANTKRADTAPSKVEYSPRVSTWLDHSHLAKDGRPTNWKRQYRLRHNWSKGICRVTEIEFPQPPCPPMLVKFCAGFIFTADSGYGLRAWIASNPKSCVASMSLSKPQQEPSSGSPTALAASRNLHQDRIEIAVGFQDGRFSVYDLNTKTLKLGLRFIHAGSTDEMITAMASSNPYLLTVSQHKVLSLYRTPSALEDSDQHRPKGEVRLLTSLKADNIVAPLSLSIRATMSEIIASIVYSFFHIGCGWSLGIQELRLDKCGHQIGSRLATTVDSQYGVRPIQSLSLPERAHHFTSDEVPTEPSILHQEPPTSLSYSHPYLLASHADNTLTMYLVFSASDSFFIKSGKRLWGHTSSVATVQVSDRGKAISVSSRGDEIRVWELETVLSSLVTQRATKEENSIRVSPENTQTEWHEGHTLLKGVRLASTDVSQQLARMRGCVGFDDERVLLLREKELGAPLIECYNFI